MPEGGFFERRTISPTSLTIVILLHAAGIGALALSKMEVVGTNPFVPTDVILVKPDEIPPETPPEPPKDRPPVARDTQLDYVKPLVPTVPQGPVIFHDPTKAPPVYDTGPPPKADEKPVQAYKPPPPLPEPKVEPKPPVRTEAKLRSGDLQPPYPPSEEKLEREGRVVVRITIGTDGRVKAADKVSATSEAFYSATERHALRSWRFSPAAVDGKPIESTTVLTVHFRLND
jgi:protein TonB